MPLLQKLAHRRKPSTIETIVRNAHTSVADLLDQGEEVLCSSVLMGGTLSFRHGHGVCEDAGDDRVALIIGCPEICPLHQKICTMPPLSDNRLPRLGLGSVCFLGQQRCAIRGIGEQNSSALALGNDSLSLLVQEGLHDFADFGTLCLITVGESCWRIAERQQPLSETPLMRSSLWGHNAHQPVGAIEPRMATERMVILKVDYMWFRPLL